MSKYHIDDVHIIPGSFHVKVNGQVLDFYQDPREREKELVDYIRNGELDDAIEARLAGSEWCKAPTHVVSNIIH